LIRDNSVEQNAKPGSWQNAEYRASLMGYANAVLAYRHGFSAAFMPMEDVAVAAALRIGRAADIEVSFSLHFHTFSPAK
jgi:hypothetical protein